MLEFLTGKMNSIIGMDISSTAIKIIELIKKKGIIELKSIGYKALENSIIVDHNIHDIDAVSDAIKEVIKKYNIKSKRVAIAIPESLVITKTVYMDEGLDDNEIDQQIRENLEQYLPSTLLGDIALDFSIIPRGKDDVLSSKNKMLLVAAKQKTVDTRIQVCEQAGLEVVAVDTETLVLQRILKHLKQDSSNIFCHVDIGGNSIKLCAFDSNEMIFAKEAKFGMMNLVKDIQKKYNLDLKTANNNLINKKLPNDYMTDLEIPFINSVANQISQLIQFFYSVKKEFEFSKLSISGGFCESTRLKNVLSKKINKPVIAINPVVKQKNKMVADSSLLQNSSIFTIAYGLAMRSFINDKY